MSLWLRQSTASQEVQLGKFVDSTDGSTAKTALSIANTDIKLWKEGATTQANKNSGGATHIANGWYYAVLDATDTDTLGKLEVSVDVSGALSVRREFMVVPAMIYDSLILGTDDLDTNSKKWNDLTTVALPLVPTTAGRTLDVSATGEAGVDWANVGSPTTTLNLSGTTVKTATDVETDTVDIQARLPAALTAGGNIKADALAIDGSTTAATAQSKAALVVCLGTVDTGASTTSIPTSSLTPAASATDQFKGRVVIFERGTTTVALRGQAAGITASTAGGTLTVDALSTAPASGDLFIIV